MDNVLHNYVYAGGWNKFSSPAFQRWMWTVKDSKALLILAAVAMRVTFTQNRAWSLLRYLVLLRSKPVRLRDDTNPEPLLHLS
jgi:hypothetical protein